MRVGGVYMGISYGFPDSRIHHYQRPHLKFEFTLFEIDPQDPKDSVFISSINLIQTHFVYVNKKLEGADEQAAANWSKIPRMILEEENKMMKD